ncbi:MAG: hypothetical protein ACXVDZ_14280 [Bacteroidia bacterium]
MKKTEYNFPNTARHVYDIDVFEILDQLRAKLSSNIEGLPSNFRDLKFIDDDEESFVSTMKKQYGIDVTENRKYRNYILPSSNNMYQTYLGWKILSMDPYKIEPLLSYQSVLFLGNDNAPKDNFLGSLEFSVYVFVKGRIVFDEFIRLEKMVDWMERNRVFLLNKAYQPDEIVESEEDTVIKKLTSTKQSLKGNAKQVSKKNKDKQVIDTTPNVRIVLMAPEFAAILVEKLKSYFPEDDYSRLFDLIIKNKMKKKLPFFGNRNQIAELFKRLHYNGKITVNTYDLLARWISNNFNVFDKGGKIEVLNANTILSILKNSKKEPPKGKRILEDMAVYIMPIARRQAKENLTK